MRWSRRVLALAVPPLPVLLATAALVAAALVLLSAWRLHAARRPSPDP
jgi:hypothetical protein